MEAPVIATTGSHDVVAADLDGDGRPDILGANHGGAFQPVELWQNVGPLSPGSAARQALERPTEPAKSKRLTCYREGKGIGAAECRTRRNRNG